MTYEDRFRGQCIVYVHRGDLLAKIMFLTPVDTYPFYRLIAGEMYADFDTYQEAFDTLAVL
jgi:hypothetical protein